MTEAISRGKCVRTLSRRLVHCAVLACLANVVSAQTPGTPDSTWTVQSFMLAGVEGMGDGPEPKPQDIELQPDGKLLVTARTPNATDLVHRFNPDGSLDTSFGTGGTAQASAAGRGSNLERDAPGRIYVAGSSVTRLLSNGTVDTSYGANGVVNAGTTVHEMELQPDGKLVLLNESIANSSSTFTLGRLNVNGQLDTSFGSNGIVRLNPNGFSRLKDMAIAADASIYILVENPTQGTCFVYKLHPNGQLDSSFGSGGQTPVPALASTFGNRTLEVQADGKLIIGGAVLAEDEALIVRLRADGSPDPGFGTAGVARFNLSTLPFERTDSLALEPDGKIIVGIDAGTNEEFYTQEQIYLRLLPNGSIDESFARQSIGDKELVDLAVGPGGLFALAYYIYDTPTNPPTEGTYFVRNFHAGPWPRRGSFSTGAPSASGFQIDARGLTDARLSEVSSANPVELSGYIFPESVALGTPANIYVAVATARGLYMRNASGNFVPWSGRVADLTPAYSNVQLSAQTHVPVYAGNLPFTGEYRLYVGYNTSGGPLVYIDTPALLMVN
jgi:uncharacterized delta-60 repeat protein